MKEITQVPFLSRYPILNKEKAFYIVWIQIVGESGESKKKDCTLD